MTILAGQLQRVSKAVVDEDGAGLLSHEETLRDVYNHADQDNGAQKQNAP